MDKSDIIKALIAEKESLLKEAASIDDAIRILKRNNAYVSNVSEGKKSSLNVEQFNNKEYSDYNKSWTILQKALYALNVLGRFSHIKEIEEKLVEIEPDIKMSKTLSTPLSNYKKLDSSKLVSIKVGKSNQNFFWGFKSWVDAKGNPLQEFYYDQSKLVGSNKMSSDFFLFK